MYLEVVIETLKAYHACRLPWTGNQLVYFSNLTKGDSLSRLVWIFFVDIEDIFLALNLWLGNSGSWSFSPG